MLGGRRSVAAMTEEDAGPTRDELIAQVAQLRAELERLRAELRLARRDHHERPPHWEA